MLARMAGLIVQRPCETSTTFTLLLCGLLQPKAASFPLFLSFFEAGALGGSLIVCSEVPLGAVPCFWGALRAGAVPGGDPRAG